LIYDPPFFGSRDIGPTRAFVARNYYKIVSWDAFSAVPTGNPNCVDLWNDVPLYGKVSEEGILVMPAESRMKYVLGASKTALLPWAYEAVIDFQTYLARAQAQGRTALGALFGDFTVMTSYKPPYEAYFMHAASVMLAFGEHISSRPSRNVTTFEEYASEFIRYVGSLEYPVTFASYFASSRTSLFSTGLMVSFDVRDANEDGPKNFYFMNQEFDKYVKGAAAFGLRVDQNAPWRLIADMNSKPMATYLARQNLPTLSDAFDQYYTRAVDYELAATMQLLHEGYTHYANTHKANFITKYCLRPDFLFKRAISSEVTNQTQVAVTIQNLSKESFAQQYNIATSLRLLEAIKKAEQRRVDAPSHRIFKRRFNRYLDRGELDLAAVTLTRFYNGPPTIRTTKSI